MYDEMKEVHNNLGALRKQYDDYRTQALSKDKEIQKFKVENAKLKLVEEDLENQNINVFSELDEKKSEFQAAKLRFEESVQTKKSYNYILSRLKVTKNPKALYQQHDLICF